MPKKIVRIETHDAVIEFGGSSIILIAGPCSVDSEELLFNTATEVKKAGARMLRGDAFKPRTSPQSFQGLGIQGLKILCKIGKEVGLPTVTEIMDTESIPLVAKYADMLKIGARNMQNFSLLKKLGKINKPVILKRGFGATIEELLHATEYLKQGGNENIVLCERGIRTFETSTRFTFDINAIPKIKELSTLPIIADPSHATGQKQLVEPIALASIAAGADGLLLEVHANPKKALSDKDQTINTKDFARLAQKASLIAKAVGRTI